MRMMNQSLLDSQAIADRSLRLCFRVMSPKESIEQLIEFFNIQIQAKNLKVDVRIDEDAHQFPTKVVCDNSRFQEMVFHILANAIKFNKEYDGHVEIVLSFQLVKNGKGEGKLVCEVKDTGQGMSKLQITQSFEAFGNVSLQKKLD